MEQLSSDFGGTFPFEARWLDTGDVRLHYVDEGPRDATPVLMLHGNGTWSYMYRRPIAELSASGHRCVAYDHMGFGRSDKPPYMGAYSLERHVENALGVIDRLDLRDVLLVLHDWGGPIGLGAALQRRDRLRGIALMNTWAWSCRASCPRSCASSEPRGSARSSPSAATCSWRASPAGCTRARPTR
jgi:pimeloyl-ACP methyl ester carboxylesterase